MDTCPASGSTYQHDPHDKPPGKRISSVLQQRLIQSVVARAETAEDHRFDGRGCPQCILDRGDGRFGSQIEGITIDARTDAGKRHRLQPVGLRNPDGASITGRKERWLSPRAIAPERRFSIAIALGSCLAESHQLSATAAADVDVDSLQLTPFTGGDTRFVIAQTLEIAERAAMQGAIDHSEAEWIEMTCRAAETLDAPHITCVHVDYKTGNLCLTETRNGYRVSGLFDFHEARFSNGTQDLLRHACSFINFDMSCAHEFVCSTLAYSGMPFRIDELMRLFVINDRIKIWEYFTQPEEAPVIPAGLRFRDWANHYLESGVFKV